MARYRKLPVEIEAVRYGYASARDGEAPLIFDDYPLWLQEAIDRGDIFFEYGGEGTIWWELRIVTLEGVMSAEAGYYIIRGVEGELYPCREDIFAMTYEKVADV